MSAFIAPTIVFFAMSGALQIFGFQEAHGDYRPSTLLSSVARLHKQQVFAPEPPRDPRPQEAGSRGKGRSDEPTISTLLLKGFFFLEALALVVTTAIGVWIGVTHAKRARTFVLLLAAGALVPTALILF